jgi:hypothetical protein
MEGFLVFRKPFCVQPVGLLGVEKEIDQRKWRTFMTTKFSLFASIVLLGFSLGAAQAADTNPNPGTATGSPGAENKGNPMVVPDQATTSPGQSNSAVETTPGEEAKGKPAIKE